MACLWHSCWWLFGEIPNDIDVFLLLQEGEGETEAIFTRLRAYIWGYGVWGFEVMMVSATTQMIKSRLFSLHPHTQLTLKCLL